MDSSDASMSTSLVWTKLQHTFFGWAKNPQESGNSADASATTVQNIPDSPDISTTCLYFHDCAHGDGLRRRQECHGFDVSWIPHDMDSSDASNVYITELDEATTYTFLAGRKSCRNQRKLTQ
jgi:hypothetical protein